MTAPVKPCTAWARKRRERAWREKAQAATKCPAVLARGVPCRTPLQNRFVNGETVPYCPTCEKKRAGLCIEPRCTDRVYGTVGKALRCALHAKVARQAHETQWRERNRHRKNIKERQRARDAKPERLEYKRLWRQSRPGKVAEHKRRYAQKHAETVRAYMAAYRAKKREERAARELARYHGTLPPRTCVSCDTVLTGRAKKCDSCKATARQTARAAIAARLAA